MAQRKQASTGRAPQRILRVGIIQGGRIIEERLIQNRKTISIGQGPRNSFVISSANLPRKYDVFTPTASGYELRFAPGMDGRVTVGGGVRTLTQIREQKIAKPSGDWWHLPMESSSRGKLVVGDVTVLFQFVPAPPNVPHARLPATIRGSVTSHVDNLYASIIGGCFALGLVFGIAAEFTPKPKPTQSKRIRQLVEASVKSGDDMKPKPPPMSSDMADMDAGMDDGAGMEAVVTPSNSGKSKADPAAAAKAKKEFAKGSEGYKKLLDEVTQVAMASGGGTMGGIVIAGQCSGAECEKATVGVDGLRNGKATTDLDDVAANSGASGATTQTGPGSGRPGHGGVVRGGRPGGAITGMGVGSDRSGTPGGDAPMSVVKIAAKFTPVVPPLRLEGGAGDKIRKKVASLVYGLRFCYNRALQSNPKLQGAVKVSVVIMPNGRMSNVNAESGMGGGVAECIKGRVQSWSLGEVGKQAFYSFTLQFAPGGS